MLVKEGLSISGPGLEHLTYWDDVAALPVVSPSEFDIPHQLETLTAGKRSQEELQRQADARYKL